MTKRTLFLIWAILFALCAALGFIPEPSGFFAYLMTVLSVLFFVPPAVLLRQAKKNGDTAIVKLLRNLSALSLLLTLVLLIANFLTALSSEFLGNVLHYILTIVSTPMMASRYWVLSLFLWSCLLMYSLKKK